MIALAAEYGRYGYRRITALLRQAGWQVGKDRVQRIWRREGLKVPQKQKPRRRSWLNDGSCIRLQPGRRNCAKSRLRLNIFQCAIGTGATISSGMVAFPTAVHARRFLRKR
jgi:transposase InsO family protein